MFIKEGVARMVGYQHDDVTQSAKRAGKGIGNMDVTACGPGFPVDGATERCSRA